ncbi:MAG: hypothetical protein ACOC9P_00645, partial [bacterium]
GLDDGNYYQIALALVERLEEADASQAEPFRQKLRQIIGRSDDAVMRVVDRPSRLGAITRIENTDVADMRKAKRRLLSLIASLRETLPPQRPSLRYGDIQMTEAGTPQFSVICPDELAEARGQLRAALRELDDELTLNQSSQARHRLILATFGHLPTEQAPVLGELSADLSASYPGAGDYVIRTTTAADGSAVIALIGGDAAGLAKAVTNWTAFLEYAPGDSGAAPSPEPASQ